ncbi:hypothetical protein HY29_04200 [Hyphomonas beringensis]|uniref:Alanine racemase n=1 Tax=Hyphomonas beringensis TaxID=1280946 RepID=A0A062U2H7_9PROT|nr:alanine racemase [Hyphomonas beringensis]KCZ52492.1 hypothetical protein HY29_04200 [Hyphomonas beringensis]
MISRPQATIHLANIAANWQALDRLNPGSTTAAVIKANGYGLGDHMIAQTLMKMGCTTFFVAHIEEAVNIRRLLGAGARIFVLNGVTLRQARIFIDKDLTPVLSTDQHVALWAQAPRIGCALHFDTGMNRLGLSPDRLSSQAETMRKLQPLLVMSHLACADEPDNPLNAQQLKAFAQIAAAFPDVPASLANSAGCFLGHEYAFDLTRPGIALYGGSQPPLGITLQPAITLEALVLSVFEGKAGQSVGYGATHMLKQDTLLATVALGYADGIPRSGGNALMSYLDGTPCPVLGRISMDLITIDVSKAQKAAKPGARVEFLGYNAKLEEQAARAGTLGYELLTGLGYRVKRNYR